MADQTADKCQGDDIELDCEAKGLATDHRRLGYEGEGFILTKTTRQKTCLIALGKDNLGFSDSAEARPTSSVPPKENAAATKTEHTPLKLFAKEPGLS